MELTEDEVQTILKLVDELEYGEIHLEIGDFRLDIMRERPSPGTPARDHLPKPVGPGERA